MQWTAAVTSSSDWLTITSGASGTNSGTVTCAYAANTASASRIGTIRVTADGATGSPKDVTVVQAPSSASTPSQVLGAWQDGVWAWDNVANKWNIIPSATGCIMMAAGKVDADDTIDDLIGV